MNNALDDFLEFVKNGQNFRLIQIADKEGEFHLGIKISNKEYNLKKLKRKKDKALYYLQNLFANSGEKVLLITKHEIKLLKKFNTSFCEKSFEGDNTYWWHKNITVDQALDQDFIVSKEMSHFHYHYISNVIFAQKEATEEILQAFENNYQSIQPGNKKDLQEKPLETHTNKGNKVKNEKKLYTLDELANLFQVTRRTIYNWKDNGTLPFTQIGSKIYLTQEQLDELLKQHQIKSNIFRK